MATATKGDRFEIVIAETNELIIVDAALRETHADAALFTQFPVGKGSNITDHKQNAPAFLSADLLITDSPVDTPESNVDSGFRIEPQRVSVRLQSSNPLFPISTSASIDTKGPNSLLQRGKEVYTRLQEVIRDGLLLSITTSRRVYENMVLTRLEVPVDNSERATIISCDFQQITFAESETAEVEVVEEPNLKKEKNKGAQPAVEETSPAQQNRSALAAATSALFGG